MLSLSADFRTKERRRLMAHQTIYRSVKRSGIVVCDRNQFARVCIKHRCLPVEVFKEGNSCAAQAFKYDHKRDDFSIVARFLVLIPAAMST